MKEQVYKKVGRRYIPIGYSDRWTGFPAEGLWAVYNKPGVSSSSCIAFAGEIKPIDYSLFASLIVNKEDDCLKSLEKLMSSSKGYSRVDIVKCIFETILNEKTS